VLSSNQDPLLKTSDVSGILPINKPKGKTSFSLVSALRRIYKVKKVGHAGTLDPFATGVMILLVGKKCTKLSDLFLHTDKEYIATLRLGIETDSYDSEGNPISSSSVIPSLEAIQKVLMQFQGTILQIPPMFSAKKVQGKKLYELARKGIEIERKPETVTLTTTLLHYEYPHLAIRVTCSKGTYIRSLASDIGKALGCGAHLSDLCRTRSGLFSLTDCIDGTLLQDPLVTPSHLRLLSPESLNLKLT
jgi:tRNA pseudouridine55 synthase